MKVNYRKYFYKVISLLIKMVIFIFSIYYIWQKVSVANNTVEFSGFFEGADKSCLCLACFLLFINWGLEAVKWKILVSKFEKISFLKSLSSVFSGVTISIFTPNRVGEFAGRVFYLEKADKIQATIASMVGGALQMLITIIAGVSGYYILESRYEDYFRTSEFVSANVVWLLLFCFVLFVSILVFIYRKRNKYFKKYKKYIEVLTLYSKAELVVLFLLSLIRYSVFSFQYYLVLKLFGVNAGTTIFFSLIALTFFVTSVIPTVALSEIAVRGATAVYFFSPLYPHSSSIVAASLLLWFINLAFPALIGGIFIWKLKFFKES